ncbi:MAG: ATP-binding protein, partial [Gammaproteobacteria bacterium]
VELVKRITQASSKLFSQEVSFEVLCDDAEYLELWEEETVAVSLVVSELITNAMKHRSPDAVDSDGVRVILQNDESKLIIEVANVLQNAEIHTFNFEESLANGGVGLGMMQSLMPPEGAELEYSQEGNYLLATLNLQPPVILNMYASEMNILEAVS